MLSTDTLKSNSTFGTFRDMCPWGSFSFKQASVKRTMTNRRMTCCDSILMNKKKNLRLIEKLLLDIDRSFEIRCQTSKARFVPFHWIGLGIDPTSFQLLCRSPVLFDYLSFLTYSMLDFSWLTFDRVDDWLNGNLKKVKIFMEPLRQCCVVGRFLSYLCGCRNSF